MRKFLLPLFAALLAGCSTESATGSGSNSGLDSIASFRILHDSTGVDANNSRTGLPSVAWMDDSTLEVQDLIQVTCGYGSFSVGKRADTLIVTGLPNSGMTCEDWTAAFYYKAEIAIRGKCDFVRFIGKTGLLWGTGDTTISVKR
jgi:hypothetical protein